MITSAHTASIFITVVVAMGVGISASAYMLRDATPPRIAEAAQQHMNTVGTASVALPVRIIIPTLQIDTPIEIVGRTEDGAMQSPSNFRDVAWYKEGARPGENGSAVVAGHLDNALGIAGVFKNLDTLSVGSYVYVQTISGQKKRFRVMRVAEYRYDEVPTRELFEKSGGKYLNLITCSGSWLWKDGTYDQRLIVYTEHAPEGYGGEEL